MEKFPVWLTTNEFCNLDCRWCYHRADSSSAKLMDFQLAQRLVDMCSKVPAKRITLIGGEPTLYPHFFDIARHAKSRGLITTVISNSVRFADDAFVQEARDAGVVAVTTSLKASSGKEYRESTGRDVFDRVRQAILNLEKSDIAQHVAVTVSGSIVANWEKMVGFIKECGASHFYFSFEKPSIRDDGTITFDERMMPQHIGRFIQDVMYPSLIEAGINFKMELMFPHCVLKNGFIERLERECHALGSCLLTNCEGVVFAVDGSVLPCNHFVSYSLGKFGEDFTTPDEFLQWRQSGKAKEFYELARLAPCERCAKCVKWSKCGSGCRLYWLYRGPIELLPISSP